MGINLWGSLAKEILGEIIAIISFAAFKSETISAHVYLVPQRWLFDKEENISNPHEFCIHHSQLQPEIV